MDFGFSEEQEMLRDAAKRFLADNCPTTFVRKMMAHDTAHDADFYKKLVELGWPGLLIPEQYGGAGGTFLDLTVIMEEAGKALVPGPFFATALLGVPLILEGGSEAQKKELLPKLAAGEAWPRSRSRRPQAVSTPGGIGLKAEKKGNRYVLTGEKLFVPDAHVANCIGVVARDSTGLQARRRHQPVPGPERCQGPDHHSAQDRGYDAPAVPPEVRGRRGRRRGLVGAENQGWPILRRTLDIATAGVSRGDCRHRAARARHVGRLRQNARAVRQTNRRFPGHQAQMRGHDGGGRKRPLAHLLCLLDGG